jgi:hypothetical protein
MRTVQCVLVSDLVTCIVAIDHRFGAVWINVARRTWTLRRGRIVGALARNVSARVGTVFVVYRVAFRPRIWFRLFLWHDAPPHDERVY